MKVVFLDIDGVLNTEVGALDDDKVKLLLQWAAARDVQFVLSSSWRMSFRWMQELNKKGIYWIDTTPILAQDRGVEIGQWLKENQVTKYAILDDDHPSKFLPQQRKHLVQTSFKSGLKQRNLDKLDRILYQ